MRAKWLLVLLPFAALGAYAALVFLAQPAAPHTYFAADKRGVQVIAHRGGAGLRPEETLEAFAHAAALGVDMFDLDVRATADGAIVLLHDATVDRTTDGKGAVAEIRLSELRKLDAGYRWTMDGGRTFPYRAKDVRVPTLEEVFKSHPRMRMVVEMKVRTQDFPQSLCRLTREAGMSQRVLVASFDHESLHAFRQACPEVATSMSAREARVFVSLAKFGLASAYSPDAAALQVPQRFGSLEVLTQGLVQAARGRNLRVHAWTINDEAALRRLIELGVDGIMTDRPDRLLALRTNPVPPGIGRSD